MPTTELEVQVRPSRVVLLIGRESSPEEIKLATQFLSRLWGGRYCPIFAVSASGIDPDIQGWLERDLPDFVYGIGVDHDAWKCVIREISPIWGYGQLQPDFVNRFYTREGRSVEDHISFVPVFRRLQQEQGMLGRRSLYELGVADDCELSPFVAAAFGHCELGFVRSLHIPRENGGYVDKSTSCADFISHCRNAIQWRSWLDVTSLGLAPQFHGASWDSPTIVVVDSIVPDLALYWRIRGATLHELPQKVIPVPEAELQEENVLDSLAQWVEAMIPLRMSPSPVLVVSETVSIEVLERLSAELRVRIQEVEVLCCDEHGCYLPSVTLTEGPQTVSVDLSDQVLTWRPPRPALEPYLQSGTWVVELLRDQRTRRVPGELALPSRRGALDALNAPIPPLLPQSPRRYGMGFSGLNFRCCRDVEVDRHRLPTSEEVLSSILVENNVTSTRDEKRSLYEPAIRLFGGLPQAAEAFVDPMGSVLEALRNGPRRLDEIMNATKLGNRVLPGLARPEGLESALERESPMMQRIATERFDAYWDLHFPGEAKVPSLLEHWADRGVLRRRWQLPKCSRCGLDGWTDNIDILQPVVCQGCGERLRLPDRVPLGYDLNRVVMRAVEQGLGPVALTGRFLNDFCYQGFLGLPGVKYRWDGRDGDIDFIAACDRHLVFAECKDLAETGTESPTWTYIFHQFQALVEVAEHCDADLVVLAVRAADFPRDWRVRVHELVRGRVKALILDGGILEQGNRFSPGSGMGGTPFPFSEILSHPECVVRPRKDYAIDGSSSKYYRGRPATEEEKAVAAYYLWEKNVHEDDVARWYAGMGDLEKGVY